MPEDVLTREAIGHIASAVDDALAKMATVGWQTRENGAGRSPLRRHKAAITRASGENAESFLHRFRQAGWKDLCVEGGQLHGLRKRWLDPTKPDVIKTVGALLAGMGVSGNLIPVLVIPLLIIILHIGSTAFCDLPPPTIRKGSDVGQHARRG